MSGDDEQSLAALHEHPACARADARRPIFYLAIPPSAFPTTIEHLLSAGCTDGARVVIEKPFGRDLELGTIAERDAASLLFLKRRSFRIDRNYLGEGGCTAAKISAFLVRQRVPQAADMEPAVRGERAHHDGRVVRRRGARRSSTMKPASFVTSCRTIFAADCGLPGDGNCPSSVVREALRDEQAKVLRTIRPLSPAETVLGQFRVDIAARQASRRAPTFRLTRRFICSSTRGAGRGCRFT